MLMMYLVNSEADGEKSLALALLPPSVLLEEGDDEAASVLVIIRIVIFFFQRQPELRVDPERLCVNGLLVINKIYWLCYFRVC